MNPDRLATFKKSQKRRRSTTMLNKRKPNINNKQRVTGMLFKLKLSS
jgi:hypothetical protein